MPKTGLHSKQGGKIGPVHQRESSPQPDSLPDQIKRTHFHFKPGMGYWLGLFIMSVYEGLVCNPLSPSGNVIVCMCLILKSSCFFKYCSVIRPKLFQKVAESEATRSRKQRLREDCASSPTSLGTFRAQEPIMYTWSDQRCDRKEVRTLRGTESRRGALRWGKGMRQSEVRMQIC